MSARLNETVLRVAEGEARSLIQLGREAAELSLAAESGLHNESDATTPVEHEPFAAPDPADKLPARIPVVRHHSNICSKWSPRNATPLDLRARVSD